MSQTPDSILQAGLHPTFDQIGKNFGSCALPGKMFLVRIVIKFMLILGNWKF